MRIKTTSAVITVMLLGAAASLHCQSSSTKAWSLPTGTAVTDSSPRTYRFVVDYNMANSRGEMTSRQRLAGEYTRGLAGGEVMWKNVTHENASGATDPFAPPQKQEFMEGFRYRNDLGITMAPDFFKGFPPTAMMERNLVWDTGMIEMFGQDFFDRLKLNQPHHIFSDQNTKIPGVGSFQNHDVVLEWIGRSKRNGQECALIRYQAFFNPLQIATGGMSLNGRSDYWGEIWVSLASRQIEYATIYESVVGEMKLPGQDAVMNMNVFRNGSFEPVDIK